MATIIKSTGETVEVQPKNNEYFSLEEMQEIVGGYIEFVYLPDDKIMVVNEEGKIHNLPMNDVASVYVAPYDYIAGNALICKNNEIR